MPNIARRALGVHAEVGSVRALKGEPLLREERPRPIEQHWTMASFLTASLTPPICTLDQPDTVLVPHATEGHRARRMAWRRDRVDVRRELDSVLGLVECAGAAERREAVDDERGAVADRRFRCGWRGGRSCEAKADADRKAVMARRGREQELEQVGRR